MSPPLTFEHLLRTLLICLVGDAAFSVVIYYFYREFCRMAEVVDPFNESHKSQLPFWISGYATGFIERLIFSIGVALNLSGVGVAMIAWTDLKAQSHWHIFTPKEGDDRYENI